MSNRTPEEKTQFTPESAQLFYKDYLRKRAVPLDLAKKESVWLANPAEILQLVGYKTTGGGLVVNYDTRCGAVSVARRIYLEDRSGPKVMQAKGDLALPFIPSSVTSTVETPLFIVEGPLKALSLLAAGHEAVALAGVDGGFFDPTTGLVQAALAPYLVPGRRIYLCLDANCQFKTGPARAEARIACHLLSLGHDVRLVELPPLQSRITGAKLVDMGPDDFLANLHPQWHAGGPEEFAKLVAQAAKADPLEMAAAIKWDRARFASWNSLSSNLRFAAALHAHAHTVDKNVAQILGVPVAEVKQLGDKFHKLATEKFQEAQEAAAIAAGEMFLVGDNAELGARLASDLGDKAHRYLVFDESKLWRFQDDSTKPAYGVWGEVTEAEQHNQVCQYSGLPIAGGSQVRLKTSDIKGVARTARDLMTVPGTFAGARDGVCFQDCFVTLVEGKLTHTGLATHNYARHAHPFNYPSATHCPKWLAFLRTLWTCVADADEKIAVLQEFLGACLLGLAPKFKHILFLEGTSDSGKTTLLRVIEQLFPPASVGCVSDFRNPFSFAHLAGKLINIVDEMPVASMKESEHFKRIVSGSPTQASFKNQDEFTFCSRCGHIFTGNHYPNVKDSSGATINRYICLELPNVFAAHPSGDQLQRRVGVEEQMLSEVPQIIRWSLEGAARLVTQGHYTNVAHSESIKQLIQANSDTVSEFFHDQVIGAPGGRISSADLYEAYQRFCVGESVPEDRRWNRLRFGMAARDHIKRLSKLRDPKVNDFGVNRNEKGWLGIGLKSGAPQTQPRAVDFESELEKLSVN
jgi:P4 family phage/plasmid primase-like protien